MHPGLLAAQARLAFLQQHWAQERDAWAQRNKELEAQLHAALMRGAQDKRESQLRAALTRGEGDSGACHKATESQTSTRTMSLADLHEADAHRVTISHSGGDGPACNDDVASSRSGGDGPAILGRIVTNASSSGQAYALSQEMQDGALHAPHRRTRGSSLASSKHSRGTDETVQLQQHPVRILSIESRLPRYTYFLSSLQASPCVRSSRVCVRAQV